MKKINKKKKKIIIILLIVIIFFLIIGLFVVKANYLKKYNRDKYYISLEAEEVDTEIKRKDFDKYKFYCYYNICYENKFNSIDSDIVLDESKSTFKSNKANEVGGYAFYIDDALQLKTANFDNKGNTYMYTFDYLPKNKKYNSTTNFLVDYLHVATNFNNEGAFNNNYGESYKKEAKKFFKKTGITIDSNDRVNAWYDIWNFYSTYKSKDLYLSDSIFKILDEYNNLEFYNNSFKFLLDEDIFYTTSVRLDYNSKIKIIKILHPHSQIRNTYIVSVDSSNYLIFWDIYIFSGFKGWSEEDVEEFALTIHVK